MQLSGQAIEIMDVTLRDGEQTQGIAFNSREKLHLAKSLLEQVNVDRIEIASARISEGERDAVRSITEWAGGQTFWTVLKCWALWIIEEVWTGLSLQEVGF